MERHRRAALAGIQEKGYDLELGLSEVLKQNSGRSTHTLEHDPAQSWVRFKAQYVEHEIIIWYAKYVTGFCLVWYDRLWQVNNLLRRVRCATGHSVLHTEVDLIVYLPRPRTKSHWTNLGCMPIYYSVGDYVHLRLMSLVTSSRILSPRVLLAVTLKTEA